MDVCIAYGSTVPKTKLDDLPKLFANPEHGEGELQLSGVIEWIEGSRDKDGKTRGHYKAYAYRKGSDAWEQMDDCVAKVERIKGSLKVATAVIILVNPTHEDEE
ncbi:hypothetical protein QAD02_007220 [Eretmocerus hayati]|uniref:Uncharacterized protein n=1 Tax=Eretmocerus hayati TaxID=131215 RepID=A0ACC2N333_9HYME|nr:hypothetical protein QAD02_007220 [Eretmocerus hayati]